MASGKKKSTRRRSNSGGKTPKRSPVLKAPSATAASPLLMPPPLKRFLGILGPGLVTGASDDDPAGIATYSAAGARFGFATLWTALFTFPMMAAVQFICAKIGLVSGQGIAGVIRQHYPRALLYPVVLALFLANTFNAAADLAAVAAGVKLLVPKAPVAILVLPIGLTILLIMIWGSYRTIARIFKWLTLSLFAYIVAGLLSRPDWLAVLKATVVPTIHHNAEFLAMLVAILGTTISPYLFFWQASQEVEEYAAGHKRLWQRVSANELRYAFWDVNIGMFLSNAVMYFIILTTAATLHRAGQTEIGTAAEAAEALRPLAGDAAYTLMALGLIGTGVLAVPVLTGSASYAAAEAFGWKYGLDEKPGRATKFYLVLALSMILAIAIDLLGINPVKALLWSAVVNGFLAPPLLVVIMLISNNRRIMGERVNNRPLNVLGWLTTAAMWLAAAALVVSWLS